MPKVQESLRSIQCNQNLNKNFDNQIEIDRIP